MPSRFAYLLERYPAFTQTFIVREVEEMRRQGVDPLVISLRPADPDPGGHFSADATANVITLPDVEPLTTEVKRRRVAGEMPKTIQDRIKTWGEAPDKRRLYEAVWVGDLLQKRGVRHVHVHFAGLAARTACFIKELYGISYSFTGHAQDIFCKTDHTITLGRLLRDASAVITVSDFSAKQLRFNYPALAGKIHRVYNGLVLPNALPHQPKVVPPLIVSVGRLIPKKGFADLIEACALLKERGVTFQCQIVGDGPLTDELQRLVSERNLSNEVALLGPKSQTEIAALLKTAHVFALAAVVMPDGDSDNLPTVITEAMAHGLPVVSTRVAGIPEQVIDGKTGFVVSPGDVNAFADKLATLLRDYDLTRLMGEAGFAKAQADFSLSATVRQLRKILPLKPWWRPF